MFAVGDDATAIGALAGGGHFGRGTAVGAVGDGVALLAWVGLQASFAVEDQLIAHVPVAVRVAFQHFLRSVVDDVVAHHCIERNCEHFLVAVLGKGLQRAVLDGNLFDHISLAHADVFIKLLFVRVEQRLALKWADGLPVFGYCSLFFR